MRKNVIALAVAGVLAVPMAAQAGVEVYGQARLSVGFISDDSSVTGADDSSLAVTSHSSRLGFKGSEDLGSGLNALYQIEAQVDMDDDNSGLIVKTRNTFIGVAGDFGTVVAGRHDTPYKMATSRLDIFSDTYGDYNAVISSAHDYRSDNVLAYISPDMSGFTLAVAYVSDINRDDLPDDDTVATNGGGSALDQEAVSISGMYSNGPLYVGLGFQSISDYGSGTLAGAADGVDADAMKLGIGYKLNKTDLGFIYENTELNTSPTKADQDAIYFSVMHPVAADTNVKLAIGQLDESSSGANNGGDFVAIGVSKNMTKNAEIYALYTQFSNDPNGNNGLSNGDGPAAGDSDGVTAGTQGGGTASAFAVGMNLKFSSL